jgi:hypothetical protein
MGQWDQWDQWFSISGKHTSLVSLLFIAKKMYVYEFSGNRKPLIPLTTLTAAGRPFGPASEREKKGKKRERSIG